MRRPSNHAPVCVHVRVTTGGTLTTRYCIQLITRNCDSAAAITGNAPTAARVTFPSPSCVSDPRANDIVVSGGASGFANRGASDDGTTVTYTVTWTGGYAALDNQTYTIPLCAEPEDPEDPGDPDGN